MMYRAASWPNLLSLLRLFSTPLIGGCIYKGDMEWALGIFLFASLTDVLDGLWARWSGNVSRLGIYLDPIADKVLLVGTYGMLGLVGFLPFWMVGLVVGRDLIILGGAAYLYHRGHGAKIQPLIWGKINTILQVALVIMTMIREIFCHSWVFNLKDMLLFLTGVLGMVSLIMYCRMYLSIFYKNRTRKKEQDTPTF
jgi:cardiolipin synthase